MIKFIFKKGNKKEVFDVEYSNLQETFNFCKNKSDDGWELTILRIVY